jgi:hypothetical protein
MSPFKKGTILQKETVETVELFGLCFIIPQLKLGVNSKLRRYRTVFFIEIPLGQFAICNLQFTILVYPG